MSTFSSDFTLPRSNLQPTRRRHARRHIHHGDLIPGRPGFTCHRCAAAWMAAHPGEYVRIDVQALPDDPRAMAWVIAMTVKAAGDRAVIFWDEGGEVQQ